MLPMILKSRDPRLSQLTEGEMVDIPPVNIGNEGLTLTAEVFPETENDVVEKSRLSYSGRRIRAQRKALKRKSENPEIPVVRKKICFDEVDMGTVNQGRKNSQNVEPKNNEEIRKDANAKKDNGEVSTAKSLLSDWDDIFNEPLEENELSENIHVVPDKMAGGQKKDVEDRAPEVTKPPAIPESHKAKLQIKSIQKINSDPIMDNIPAPAQSKNQMTRDKEDETSKKTSTLKKGSSKAGQPTKEKRRSSKILFSETILDSEADVVKVGDSSELRPETIPTYDQTYRRVESKQGFKSVAATKPSEVVPMELDSILNSDKKFFKEKGPAPEKASDFLQPSTSSKPKRTYQRRPSGTTKSTAKDPYSFTSNPPKGRRSSYLQLQQKKRLNGSSRRRSEKLFSDDEGDNSVKGSPEKTFGDSGLRISDIGDMGDTGFEEQEASNLTLQGRKSLSSYSSRRRSTNKEMSKQTLRMLEHLSGMLKAIGNMSEGISKKVLSDVSFFIVQQSDLLVLE